MQSSVQAIPKPTLEGNTKSWCGTWSFHMYDTVFPVLNVYYLTSLAFIMWPTLDKGRVSALNVTSLTFQDPFKLIQTEFWFNIKTGPRYSKRNIVENAALPF